MGYLADLYRARACYRELMVVDPLTHYEHAIQLLVGHGSKRRGEAKRSKGCTRPARKDHG